MPFLDPERAMSVFRTARGLGLLVAPGPVGGHWAGGPAHRPGGKLLGQALGARDLVIGAGLLRAARSGEDAVRREWLAAGVVVDVIDLLATVGHRRALTWNGEVLALVAAASCTAIGLQSLRVSPERRNGAAVTAAPQA